MAIISIQAIRTQIVQALFVAVLAPPTPLATGMPTPKPAGEKWEAKYAEGTEPFQDDARLQVTGEDRTEASRQDAGAARGWQDQRALDECKSDAHAQPAWPRANAAFSTTCPKKLTKAEKGRLLAR